MDKNDTLVSEEKKNKSGQKVVLALVDTAALLVVELYVMIHMPSNYPVLIIFSVLFLISVYFSVNGILKELQERKRIAEEEHETLFKSAKASYYLLKKVCEELEELKVLVNRIENPTEEIITAQKALTKVTITRNKENTDAMLNSNDKVLENLLALEEKIETGQSDFLSQQMEKIVESVREMGQKQQEMSVSMQTMENSLKSEMVQAMNMISSMQERIEQQSWQSKLPEEIDLGEMELSSEPELGLGEEPEFELGDMSLDIEPELPEEIDLGEMELSSEPELGFVEEQEEDFVLDDMSLGAEPELSEEMDLGEMELSSEPELGLGEEQEEDFVLDDMPLGAEPELPEEIALGEMELSSEPELGLGEEFDLDMIDFAAPNLDTDLLSVEEPLAEETFVEEPLIEEPLVEEPLTEETFVEEPLIEEAQTEIQEQPTEAPKMPDMSDPHKLMTPEEIAALIASM